jgi:hypothetical protein
MRRPLVHDLAAARLERGLRGLRFHRPWGGRRPPRTPRPCGTSRAGAPAGHPCVAAVVARSGDDDDRARRVGGRAWRPRGRPIAPRAP